MNVVSPTRYNVYIDGSWLFKQCGGKLWAKIVGSTSTVRLDFNKMLDLFDEQIKSFLGDGLQRQDLFMYMALFRGVPRPDDPSNPKDPLVKLNALVYARRYFARDAQSAGFQKNGCFEVTYEDWMLRAIIGSNYREKMADTALVARIVREGVSNPGMAHVVVTGDKDILPGMVAVIPDYSTKAVMVMNNPSKSEPTLAQSSKRIAGMKENYHMLYLDEHIKSIAVQSPPRRA
ncbi:hypothetical protein [Nannocystis sp.]|uniref:hypothetical protein n=1 Tax=Nannocystis sp. TaxID=1962667 RepID=UPI0025EE2FC6|nr:hypothetical protein [Nannocystis sp.]MBK7829356.1 hypothetical protein [Nannocystis sp.]